MRQLIPNELIKFAVIDRKFYISTDKDRDNKVFSYCFFSVLNNQIEIMANKQYNCEATFDTEIYTLSRIFNAEIIR